MSEGKIYDGLLVRSCSSEDADAAFLTGRSLTCSKILNLFMNKLNPGGHKQICKDPGRPQS